MIWHSLLSNRKAIQPLKNLTELSISKSSCLGICPDLEDQLNKYSMWMGDLTAWTSPIPIFSLCYIYIYMLIRSVWLWHCTVGILSSLSLRCRYADRDNGGQSGGRESMLLRCYTIHLHWRWWPYHILWTLPAKRSVNTASLLLKCDLIYFVEVRPCFSNFHFTFFKLH